LEDLALEERLDATMDKAIRRLAQAKALKQISELKSHREIAPMRIPTRSAKTKSRAYFDCPQEL
jgi:hypothetical protein